MPPEAACSEQSIYIPHDSKIPATYTLTTERMIKVKYWDIFIDHYLP